MGVPALFRWLSKKYPKIVLPVVEEEAAKVQDQDGKMIEVPIDTSRPNPNGVEFDNLYLDMNGIVHPCTHPEGKPAPETEEAMMVEVFNYTERIVNMVRPRKVLFMAIDGVAPRAKMNQQRSRRFRSSQEAKEKEEARKEAVAMFESLGHGVSDETKSPKEAWDSNAITPGTPFMTLLAESLRYWVVMKLNSDPGWKNLEVVLSDASVPGEGEHKIMDYIRRQRVHPQHNPNTSHVIYGLDADLIMLSLATHEPHFKVLREDVFAQDKSNACRICGQEGHYAAQCTGTPKSRQDPNDVTKTPIERKPFIFLDVTILREYLEIELNVPNVPFQPDFERAIDDWVLLIFFVGNDFLPHLPSLEIREGAIDTLLKIWKNELHRMGGYLTNHGQLEMARAQIILEGLASREDEIFRKRREAEERQDQSAKRRKVEQAARAAVPPEPRPQLAFKASTSKTDPRTVHPSLPMRPSFDTFAAPTPVNPLPSQKAIQEKAFETGSKALGGSNSDIVANRSAIRMANMTAAEALKAELASLKPLKPKANASKPPAAAMAPPPPLTTASTTATADDGGIPGLDVMIEEPASGPTEPESLTPTTDTINSPDLSASTSVAVDSSATSPSLIGVKRKLDEIDDSSLSGVATPLDEEEDSQETAPVKTRIVHADGTVESEDTVRLYEPGYRQRYYEQKFGANVEDAELRKRITKCYVEGLAWVLSYYYQGAPSWKWFYPYHYAPFAADFQNVADMDISFNDGQPPFKPFEQLMSVFPAASCQHIPKPFHKLMLDAESPIIDFYPSEFEIDMNGKKMAWQGVALLPFIDENRLLEAMTPLYDQLTEDEERRNKWGSNVLFVSGDHSLYSFLESLYTKRKSNDPLPLDARLSRGMAGSVLPDPQCIPGATYYCPLEASKLPGLEPPLVDIYDDRSLSSQYYFPKQVVPHRSALLNGFRRPPRILTAGDHETVRRGGRGRGGGPSGYGHHSMQREMTRSASYSDYGRSNHGPTGGHNYYGSNGNYGHGYDSRGYGHSNGSYRGTDARYGPGPPAYGHYYPARDYRG